MRSSVSHRHTESLSRTNHDIGTHFPRRLEERQGKGITCNNGKTSGSMDPRDGGSRIRDGAIRCRILKEAAAEPSFGNLIDSSDNQFNAKRFGSRAEQRDGLGMTLLRDKKPRRPPMTLEIVAHCHGLRCGCRLIKHRGIGNRHAGKVADHRLKIHQRLHTPL